MWSYVKGDELFDRAELEGLHINRRGYVYTAAPLVQIEANLPRTSWYSQRLNPTIYSGYPFGNNRSEEHTSELQSLTNLVCRLLLEKKKKKKNNTQVNKKNLDHIIEVGSIRGWPG